MYSRSFDSSADDSRLSAVMDARKLKHPSAADLAETYQMTLTILFRLLFVAYAEDRDLLPYRSNGQYADRSLNHKARELVELFKRIGGIDIIENGEAFDQSATQWEEVRRLWRSGTLNFSSVASRCFLSAV
jgi:hypothetical protein